MITAFRRYLDTWVVRGFFIIMVAAFVLWGVGDVVRMAGTSTWVAKVNGEPIEGTAFQAEFQRAMAQASQGLPAGQEPTPDLRRRVGTQTLQRMVGQAALSQTLREMRIVTPDAAVRDAVMAMPGFRGPDGRFNRQTFEAVLRNNGLNEARFLDLVRAEISRRQLLSAIEAGAYVPDAEVAILFAHEFAKRAADTAMFPIAAATAPPAPEAAVLQRWYDNHPQSYATPEYRRIKAIELSPQTIAKDIPISEADLQTAYDQRKADYVTPETRTAQVITAPDQAKAAALAEKWRGEADWSAIQQQAQADGASAVQLDDATERLFPDPDLGKAVFAAAADAVSPPIKGALGWFVVKVTKIAPGSTKSFQEVHDALRDRLLADKAADVMYDRANKVDNLLANGTPFDELPGDLGLVGIAGTLDRAGNTQDGTPAPIPGPQEVRSAILTAAFQAQKGDPPRLTEVQTPTTGGSAYYALTVEDVTAPGEKPFDEVKSQVESDWSADQQRHETEQAATNMLTALKGGQSFADAATVAGVTVRRTPLVTRSQTDDGVPPELQRVLFGLKKNDSTMVETAEGFIVAQLAEVVQPDAKADRADYERVRQAATQSMARDLRSIYLDSLRQRADIKVEQKNFDSIVQP